MVTPEQIASLLQESDSIARLLELLVISCGFPVVLAGLVTLTHFLGRDENDDPSKHLGGQY